MFWQHCLAYKRPTFRACLPEKVYAANLESSKNNGLFPWHGFRKTATARKKQKKVKVESFCHSKLPVVRKM